MRYVGVIAGFILLSGCTTRLAYVQDLKPVYPVDNLVLPREDTTITVTITMLSDKMQVLDLICVEDDRVFRKARLIPDKKVVPNYGGVIKARVNSIDSTLSGYMTYVNLLEWEEYTIDRNAVRESLTKLVKQQQRRLNRLIRGSGFSTWTASGELILEGYDQSKDICVYSMVGEEAAAVGIVKRNPMLIVWATPEGRIKRIWLTTTGQLLERS